LSPAHSAPEQLSASQTGPWTDIYQLGLVAFELLTGEHPFRSETPDRTVARRLEEPIRSAHALVPELPVEIDAVLRRATGIDTSERYSSVDALLKDLHTALGTEVTPTAAPRRNPYKGLTSFRGADAVDFFGRDQLIERLVGRFAESGEGHRLLAIVGPSGSGKSSVARAGVVPALRRGAVAGSDSWLYIDMQPGHDPFGELATAIRTVSARPYEDQANRMRRDELGIHETVRRTLPGEGWELLLLVDQFEELFTMASDDDRSAFISGIVTAATHARSQLRVLFTLRADYFDRPLEHAALGALLRTRTETVLPLGARELESAIVAPATGVGMQIEEGVVGEILGDVADQPGTLPLVQYALTELFDRSESRMALRHYRAIGGVTGALSQRADTLLAELSPEAREIASKVFVELVDLGEGLEDARRRVHRSDLMKVGGQAAAELLDRFGHARLLIFDRDPITRSATVEVAHEALLREWGTLRGWIDDNRDNIRLVRRIQQFAGDWERGGRDRTLLLQGSRLAAAEEVSDASIDGFVTASREARAGRQRRRRWGMAGLALLTVVAMVAALVAVRGQNSARVAANRALALQAAATIESDPALSLALAVEAHARGADRDTTAALIASRDAFSGRRGLEVASLSGFAGTVWSVAFSPDSHRLVSANDNLLGVQWWNISDGARDSTVIDLHEESLREIRFSQDGRYLLTTSVDDTAAVWNAATSDLVVRLAGHTGDVWSIDMDATSERVVTAGRDGSVRIWDRRAGSEVEVLAAESAPEQDSEEPIPVWGARFSPDGQTVAIVDESGTLRLWNWQTGEVRSIAAHNAAARGVGFHPQGQSLVTVGTDGVARVWDVGSLELVGAPMSHENALRGVDVSLDGRLLATAGADGLVAVWDLMSRRRVATMKGHQGTVWDVTFGFDSRLVATAGEDGTARIWDTAPTTGSTLFAGHAPDVPKEEFDTATGVRSVSLHPDGTFLATSSRDGTARIWNINTTAEVAVLEGHTAEVREVVYSNDGQLIATASNDGTMRIWSAGTYAPLAIGDHSDTAVRAVEWAGDDGAVVTGDASGLLRVWTPSGDLVREFAASDRDVRQLDVNQAGLIATGSGDRTVRVWDINGSKLAEFSAHEDSVRNVAFDPTGRYLASASGDGIVFVWDLDDMSELFRIEAHADGIRGLTFSPDGTQVLTASEDLTIKIWDIPTGDLVSQLFGHAAVIWDLEFSRDGTRLAASIDNGTALLRNVSNDPDQLCSWLHDYTTRTELVGTLGSEPVGCTDLDD
jgi:WD40 repeat protein